MSYKILLSNLKSGIPVETIREVKTILQRIDKGDKLILCKHGIFNPSFLVGIVYDEEKAKQRWELEKYDLKESGKSHFIGLLDSNSKMLSTKIEQTQPPNAPLS